jgi:hypothetical protein
MKTILTEDDAAPDAREFFERGFKKVMGETMSEFVKSARRVSPDNDYTTSYYIKGNHRLSISADDPYWKLEEFTKEHNLNLDDE